MSGKLPEEMRTCVFEEISYHTDMELDALTIDLAL